MSRTNRDVTNKDFSDSKVVRINHVGLKLSVLIMFMSISTEFYV